MSCNRGTTSPPYCFRASFLHTSHVLSSEAVGQEPDAETLSEVGTGSNGRAQAADSDAVITLGGSAGYRLLQRCVTPHVT